MEIQRHRILVNGIVQGVGFRPFTHKLANECALVGFVCNGPNGVVVEVEGLPDKLMTFHHRIYAEAPSLAKIFSLDRTEILPVGEIEFIIRDSLQNARSSTFISPDVAVCQDCLRELFDANDRRYRYPFINCTNCGPRYTIVSGIPYDRPNTSMKVFPMCPDCENEYHDPANRRFHAQPNACPVCGPRLTLTDNTGQELSDADPIIAAIALLKQGRILAIRGLGGFHLAVDAQNDEAVLELRRRKGRAEKPFALMAPDLESIGRFCLVSDQEQELLRQPNRPVVLLASQENSLLAPSVAPSNRYLGFMLPYTPLQYLLLRNHFDALVMTSGNFSEEPIAIGNEEALERLSRLADYFLLHDREILQRCDDSITRMVAGKTQVLRRARGFVPSPIFSKRPTYKKILACGGELKNAVALSRNDQVFFSQHVGDLDNPAALAFFENSISHLEELLEITPEAIAYDLHPEYLSTKWALRQPYSIHIGVHHHHAHLASVMAENGVDSPCIGIILDGAGYGLDGTIWGGEVLAGDARSFERYAWLQPVAMPGGSAAIREPWRMALSYLYAAYGSAMFDLDLRFLKSLSQGKSDLVIRMIERHLNSPLTSSCGRLFDAVAALLNLRQEINFEAQAAMELEMVVEPSCMEVYPQPLENLAVDGPISILPLIRAIVEDIGKGEAVGKIASRFHWTLAEIFLEAAIAARDRYRLDRVGLSGGIFQNVQFFTYLLSRLTKSGFEVLTHSQVPCNDGGLALGQIAVADAKIREGGSVRN